MTNLRATRISVLMLLYLTLSMVLLYVYSLNQLNS